MRIQSSFKRVAGRWLADFALASALFWIATFALSGNHNRAHAVPLPTAEAIHAERQARSAVLTWRHEVRSNQIHALRESRAARTRTLVLLSLTLAGIAALNLAFWRHLRRVYASPRRGVWRRG
jgi:endonuclease/exonuclease/phosphatase family metal-dependent hydrolase